MVTVQRATPKRGNSGPRIGMGSIPHEDATAAPVVQCQGQRENSLSRNQVMPVAQHVENALSSPQQHGKCGEITSGSCRPAGGRGTLFSSRDAEGGTSNNAAMMGDQGCSLADGPGCTQARTTVKSREDPGRLRNEHDNNDRRMDSSSATFTFTEGAASLGQDGSYEDASHSVGSRQQYERRRTPTSIPAGPPPPPTNPPPHLLRRTPRRETAPNLREPFSIGDVESDGAHDGAGTANKKNKDSSVRAWQAQATRASGSNRALLPPPVGSLPRALFHKGGVLKRRGSNPVRFYRGSRRSLDFDHGHDRGSSGGSSGSGGGGGGGGGGGNGSRTRPIRSRTSDFIQYRDCSSRSSSRSSRNSKSSRSDKNSRSSRSSSRSTSGEDRKPYDVDNTRKHSKGVNREVLRGIRQVGHAGCAKSKHENVHGDEENDSSRVHGGQRRRRDSDGQKRRSREKTARENEKHKPSLQPQKRYSKARSRKAAESARRTTNSPCNTARSDRSDADGYNDQTNGSSPTCGGRSRSSEKRHGGSAEAQGSETTATASPRDPSASGGSFGELVVDGVTQRGLAWPAGPVGTAGGSSRTVSRRDKAHDQCLGEGGGSSGSFDSSGQRHSTSISPTTKRRTRREGEHLSTDIVHDDNDDDNNGGGGGGDNNVEFGFFSSRENRNSNTVDFPLFRDPPRVKVPLGDNAERRVRRESGNEPLGQTNRDSAGRVDTRRASRNSSCQGEQTRHDERSSDRFHIRRRDKPGHEASAGQEDPERGHTSSSDEDLHRSGRGDDGGHGPKKLSGKIHSRGTTGSGTPRASAGGWFAIDGQETKEDGEIEVRDIDSSSDSSAGNGRWRPKADRRRASDGAGGGERGGGNSGGGGGGCDGDDRGYCGALPPNDRQKKSLSLMLAYERGKTSDLVECVIVRDYKFFFQGREHQLMMVAQKCSKNRSSNYHVFDMHRGGFRTRLSKKNGNYLGKVRTNLKRTEATVFTNDQGVAELGAISFEKPGLVDHLRDGSQPRKFSALLPALDCDGAPLAHKVDPYDDDSRMLSYINKGRHGSMFLLQTREPTFTKGNYRLNFRGRVTVPSVKNFQLVSPDDILHTVCQFGKVGEDRFHLDYRAPINAFQAFCITLAQFNF